MKCIQPILKMKPLYKTLLISISAFSLASCGEETSSKDKTKDKPATAENKKETTDNKAGDAAKDSNDSTMKESMALMNQMADTYDKIADGSLEGDAAIAKIKELNAKMKKAAGDPTKVMSEEETEKFTKMLEPVTNRLTESLTKATTSGKLTPEMLQAMAEAASN